MGFDELVKNPHSFRCGDNYRASHAVFPVEFEGDNYIVKKSSWKGFFSNLYYVALDSFFFDTRKICTASRSLKEEAKKLKKLDGHCAPKLYAEKRGILVKEFKHGAEFKHMNLGAQRSKLESIVATVKEIHDRGVVIGDANVKNYLHPYCWLDFDGVFKSLTPLCDTGDDKSLDLLKLIYSTYGTANSESIDEKETLTYMMANVIKRYYNDESVLRTLGFMMEPAKSMWQMWLTTRIPRDGAMLKELRSMFK